MIGNKRKNAHIWTFTSDGDPSEIRTRVTAVKGRCPRPLDDRVKRTIDTIITEKKLFCKNYFMKSRIYFSKSSFPVKISTLHAGASI